MKARSFFQFLICLVVVAAATALAQTLTCSSNDMGRHFCRANTANGVQMVRQRSGSPCTQGSSWGYDNGGIWADHGCRADFSLGDAPWVRIVPSGCAAHVQKHSG